MPLNIKSDAISTVTNGGTEFATGRDNTFSYQYSYNPSSRIITTRPPGVTSNLPTITLNAPTQALAVNPEEGTVVSGCGILTSAGGSFLIFAYGNSNDLDATTTFLNGEPLDVSAREAQVEAALGTGGTVANPGNTFYIDNGINVFQVDFGNPEATTGNTQILGVTPIGGTRITAAATIRTTLNNATTGFGTATGNNNGSTNNVRINVRRGAFVNTTITDINAINSGNGTVSRIMTTRRT